MFNLSESVSLILAGLRAIIAQIAYKRRDRTEFLVFVHGRIGRTIQRFQQLYARWKNGALPKPRAPRPAGTRTPRLAKPLPFRLPRRRAWLLAELQHYEANGRASQFRHLLANTPELAEFLAAAPQAARLLRPICRMLGAKFSVSPAPKPGSATATPEPPPPAPSPLERRRSNLASPAPPPLFSPA